MHIFSPNEKYLYPGKMFYYQQGLQCTWLISFKLHVCTPMYVDLNWTWHVKGKNKLTQRTYTIIMIKCKSKETRTTKPNTQNNTRTLL